MEDDTLKKGNIRRIDQLPQLQDLALEDVIIVQDVSKTGDVYRKETIQKVFDNFGVYYDKLKVAKVGGTNATSKGWYKFASITTNGNYQGGTYSFEVLNVIHESNQQCYCGHFHIFVRVGSTSTNYEKAGIHWDYREKGIKLEDFVCIITNDGTRNTFDFYAYTSNTYRRYFIKQVNDADSPALTLYNNINHEVELPTEYTEKRVSYDATLANNMQQIFDVCHPIGETYVQYPSIPDMGGVQRNTVDPMTLYNVNGITSTWEELNFDGAFFRANGGLSETFGSQSVAQKAELPNVKGDFAPESGVGVVGDNNSYHGVFGLGRTTSYIVGYRTGANGRFITFSASNGQTNTDGTTYVSQNDSVYKDGGEVMPANFTVRIWRRTS